MENKHIEDSVMYQKNNKSHNNDSGDMLKDQRVYS